MIALRGMLPAGDFSSSHDFSFGGHPLDYGWQPKTACRLSGLVWRRSGDRHAPCTIGLTPARAARHAIAEHFRSLWCFGYVFDQLEETALAIGTQEYWPEGWLAVRETLALDSNAWSLDLLHVWSR